MVAVAIEAEEALLLGVEPRACPGCASTRSRATRAGRPAYYATSLFRGDRYEIELRQSAAPEPSVARR